MGRAVACSTFHHFADMNWDTDAGAPSFVTEPPGDEMKRDPSRLEIFKDYVRQHRPLARCTYRAQRQRQGERRRPRAAVGSPRGGLIAGGEHKAPTEAGAGTVRNVGAPRRNRSRAEPLGVGELLVAVRLVVDDPAPQA